MSWYTLLFLQILENIPVAYWVRYFDDPLEAIILVRGCDYRVIFLGAEFVRAAFTVIWNTAFDNDKKIEASLGSHISEAIGGI